MDFSINLAKLKTWLGQLENGGKTQAGKGEGVAVGDDFFRYNDIDELIKYNAIIEINNREKSDITGGWMHIFDTGSGVAFWNNTATLGVGDGVFCTTFYGTQFRILGTLLPTVLAGTGHVYIDGTRQGDDVKFDAGSDESIEAQQIVYTSPELKEGYHSVMFKGSNQYDADNLRYYIIEAVDVLGTLSQVSVPDLADVPERYQEYTDKILAAMTLEQLVNYALSKFSVREVIGDDNILLPLGSATSFLDVLAGADTDLPMSIHVAETWNKQLAQRVGSVIGDERRGLLTADNPNTTMYSGLGDIRCNTLAGRIFEGFSEDPYLVAELVDRYGQGAIGDDSFYTKSQISTKHYAVYHSEWDRTIDTFYISSRGLYEYQLACYRKTFKNNHHVGVMSSFGGVNGLQNPISPYLEDMQKYAKFTLFNYADYNGDYNLLVGLGNGYDESYAKTSEEVAALSILGRLTSGNQTADLVSAQDYINAVNNNTLGVTIDDLREHIRPQVELWFRGGYFSQSEYPYRDLGIDRNPITHESANSQQVALQAAEEGFVLLKNNNHVLPLSKDAKLLATGIFADYRNTIWYAYYTPDGLDNTKMTPITAMQNYLKNEPGSVTYVPEMSSDQLRFKSVAANKYLQVNGEQLEATGDNADAASIFQKQDWGQHSYSFLDTETDSYIGGDDYNTAGEYTKIRMEARNPFADPLGNQPALTFEDIGDGRKVMRYNTILTEIVPRTEAVVVDGHPYYHWFAEIGKYLTVDADGVVVQGNKVTEGYDDNAIFEVETVSEAGADASLYVADNDYAILFIGTNSFIYASEVCDRCDFNFGEDQLKLVNNVASQFPGKTIVIIRSDVPMACQELQDNDDIAAILYHSYAGQYDSYTLMRILFGDATPSGKLTNTWLKDTSSLPPIQEQDKVGIDPQYTVDMRNADPISQKLSYLYNNSDNATYEFGYGLSYTTFQIDVIGGNYSTAGECSVTVAVTNTGSTYSGKEVVQLYAEMVSSKYGQYAPAKRLVGFEKTDILAPGETQTITVSADSDYLQKWDVTQQKYILESGAYNFYVGTSCLNNELVLSPIFRGEPIGTIELSKPVNVWESNYAMIGARAIEYSKKRSIAFDGGRNFFAVHSWHKDDYVILPNVKLDGVTKLAFNVASTNETDTTIEVYVDSLNSEPICSVSFSKTEPITYRLDENILVTELGYKVVEGAITGEFGTKDLYILFKQADIRLETIQAK